MTAVIIDDEPSGRDSLKSLLDHLHPEVRVAGTAYNVRTGLEVINACRPDMLFLDIKMPDGTGFDLLEQIDHTQFAIVFITGHREFACLAFDFAAMAYIHKPIAAEKLTDAIGRAKLRLQYRSFAQQVEDLKEVIHDLRRQQLPKRLTVSNSSGLHFIPIEDITHLVSDQGCVDIYQSDGRRVIVSANLIEYDHHLSRYPQFMRVQKSFIVNLEFVRSYHSDGQATLKNGQVVDVSRRHLEEFKRRLGGL